MTRWFGLAALISTGALIGFGCSGGDNDVLAGEDGSGGKGGSGGFSVGTGGKGGNSTGNSCAGSANFNGCVGEQYAGETVPLDVYIMFDQSCSMSCPIERGGPGQCCMGGPDPRIAPVREAVTSFLRDPAGNGMGVGIGYFGYMEVGETTCDPNDYDDPSVEIGNLPGNADALLDSLNGVEPTGETPTGAAIRGACTYASEWKAAHPARETVILLVTDGIPETPSSDCGASIEDAEDAAAECNGGARPIRTYVLGVGQALQNLNRIADAGGTNAAYLVDGGNVAEAVLTALNRIRADATIPCELNIPPPPSNATLNFAQVNLAICDGAGEPTPTYRVDTPDECDGAGGWYYDDPSNPQRIILCEPTCETVTQPGAQLFYSVGCSTITEIQ